MGEYILKFVLGGSLILVVAWLGKAKYSYLAGLAMLFPVVTVVSYYFLAQTLPVQQMQKMVVFTILSLPAVLAFLLAFYFALGRYSAPIALFLGIGAWLATALIIALLHK